MAEEIIGIEQSVVEETANDRFKKGFGDWFWGSVALGTLLHFLIFAFFPQMDTADASFRSDELAAIELPPEIEIPPPPEQIARPAVPVVSTATIDEDITIAPTTFQANPVSNLPPPPSSAAGADDLMRAPVFTPMTVQPELQNRRQVQQTLERTYPPLLRDAGIGGTPTVWFFIDEDGRVLRTQMHESSGHGALDEAALRVAEMMRFSPAMNRDKKVPVWVSIPIVFQAR
jgi:periplasmic protein TonB